MPLSSMKHRKRLLIDSRDTLTESLWMRPVREKVCSERTKMRQKAGKALSVKPVQVCKKPYWTVSIGC